MSLPLKSLNIMERRSSLRYGIQLGKRNIVQLQVSKKVVIYSHYRKAVGALLVYDITKKSSFKSLQKWLIELRQFAEPDCLISLVGNKVDLVQNNPELREVSYEEAKRFADENKLILFETSAMINLQVNEAFDDLVKG